MSLRARVHSRNALFASNANLEERETDRRPVSPCGILRTLEAILVFFFGDRESLYSYACKQTKEIHISGGPLRTHLFLPTYLPDVQVVREPSIITNLTQPPHLIHPCRPPERSDEL
jgi:hypothetical protein